jgi:hypothetical protein
MVRQAARTLAEMTQEETPQAEMGEGLGVEAVVIFWTQEVTGPTKVQEEIPTPLLGH